MNNSIRSVVCMIAFAACFALSASQTANADSASGQFSITANPTGNWSYGYSTSLGGALTLYRTSSASLYGKTGLDGWEGPIPFGLASYPLINLNTTGSTISYGTVLQPANELGLHPGPTGQYSVLQWIAPSSGNYVVSGAWLGIEQYRANTNVNILANGSSIFLSDITAYGQDIPFMDTVSLTTGETIDFEVGANASFIGDMTGLTASVSPMTVPEPSSLLMLGAELLCLLGAVSWKRSVSVH